MENQQIVSIKKDELIGLMREISRLIASEIRSRDSVKFRYLKFPEEIIEITGGYIAESTIRGWKSKGYLRTIKIGTKSFVTPVDWDWFIDNHRELMAKHPDNRKDKMRKKNDKKR